MNQRRRTRVASRKAATLTGSRGECMGEIVNVSLKGCLLEVGQGTLPAEGEAVSVSIHLEPGEPGLDVSLTGRVARLEASAVAVEFTELPPESFHHLFRLVQYNAPDPESIEQELGSSAFGNAWDEKH